MKSIAEVLALPDSAVVDAVAGLLSVTTSKVEKKREDGTTYTSQMFSLSDGTGIIYGTAYDQFDMQPHHKHAVILCSLKSKNNRFGGLTVASRPDMRKSIFAHKPNPPVLRLSHAGALHTSDTYNTLCASTKRTP
jgi:hypothetical protein